MKYPILVLTLVLLFATTGLVAQPPGFGHRGADRGAEGAEGRGSDHHLFRLGHALDLTETQQEEWKTTVSEHRESRQPLFDEMQVIQTQLDDLLGLDDPDPAAIGLLVIDQRRLREDVADSMEMLQSQLALLLTAEQLATWDELREEGRAGGHRGRGPRGHHGRPA